MSKLRRASYAVMSAELPVLRTLGLEEVDPEEVFELQRKEGAGAFGRVFRACYKNDRTRLAALKVIPVALEAGERGEDIESVRREIQFLRECDHPNVVAFHGAYYKDGALWVAMEHCGGGSVGDVRRLRALSEQEIAVIMRGALQGLAYLHSRRKIHRDVKGGNILLSDSGQVKIADFGVSAQLRDTLSRRGSFVGTPYWMSPELIQDSDYDFKADIWSLGITAIELADQKPPLFDEHPMRVLIQIPRNPPPQVAHPEKWSAAFLDFLRFCLRKNPAERPTALECMQHDFIRREAHIERVFASGKVTDDAVESSQVDELLHVSTGEQTTKEVVASDVSKPRATLACTIDQQLEDEIAEEINAAPVSSQSDSDDEGESSIELLGGTFEIPKSTTESSLLEATSVSANAGAKVRKPHISASTDDLLDLSTNDSFAFDSELPALSQVDKNVEPRQQPNVLPPNATNLRQPPTEFKLLPSSAKSPVFRKSIGKTRSPHFVNRTDTSRTSSTEAFTSLSAAVATQANKPPSSSSSVSKLRPKASISPPPTPSSWLSLSSSHDDPLASIDTVTNARVNRLLSSFSTPTSSPSLTAAMRAYHNHPDADSPSRSVTRQSFNWRSVEAALPSTNHVNASVHKDRKLSGPSGKIFVGDPFQASHNLCVKYNSIQAQYEGVPTAVEWVALHQQFGIALSHMQCRSSTVNTEDQVPALLRMLRRQLVGLGGLRCKYIYRVSPIQEELQRAKTAINRGSFEPSQTTDPHVYASLVKLWLRELPVLLLDGLDLQDLLQLTNAASLTGLEEAEERLVTRENFAAINAQVAHILQKLGPRENAVFQWLLEHLLEVSAHRVSNLMTPQALATVMAPNLFSCVEVALASHENAGKLVHQVVLFLRVLLSWRRANLENSSSASRFLQEQEERATIAVDPATAGGAGHSEKKSALQQRVRESVTEIVQSTADRSGFKVDDMENVSLEGALRNRIDSLWSHATNNEVTTRVESQRQEHALRRVFSEFQRSVLQLIARCSRRSEEGVWANDLLQKVKEEEHFEMTIPPSLGKMEEWVKAALTFEAFCQLFDREQIIQDKLERLQSRFGGGPMHPLLKSPSIFNHLSRLHQQQRRVELRSLDTVQSNQNEKSAGFKVAGSDVRPCLMPHLNMAKARERPPAIGNLLALFNALDSFKDT